jgi:hypothetical protein
VEESRTSLSIIIFPTYVTLHYIHTYVFFRLSLARGTVSQHLHGMAWPGRPCFASLSMAGGQAGRQRGRYHYVRTCLGSMGLGSFSFSWWMIRAGRGGFLMLFFFFSFFLRFSFFLFFFTALSFPF